MMEQRLSVNIGKNQSYDIVYAKDFNALTEEFKALAIEDKKICIVTDSNVEKLYLNEVKGICESFCKSVISFVFQAGEESKNLDNVQKLYSKLIENQFDRKDLLIALGGGVVGDMTGFAAATYVRGIEFIQIPTTLLSQVDSSIGGKTGVDFAQYKNMVGAFHMPKLVYTNLSVLKDLPDREYFAGIAEVMKAGLIRDAIFYEWIVSNLYEICEKDMEIMLEMVERSCRIKKEIVEKDPMEQGDRALLNLGHTIGHAIEKAQNFKMLHGECVALGCVAAAFISYQKQYLSAEEYYEIRDMFVPFNLPISIENINPEEIVALTKNDKKMEGGNIKFVLLKKIGKAFVDKTVTEQEMLLAVKEIYYNEDDNYE